MAERHLCSAKDEVIEKSMLLVSGYDQSLIRCKVSGLSFHLRIRVRGR